MPIYALGEDLVFPPADKATEDGLLAVGGDLRPERLLLAYRNGIFPWFNPGDPILWWSPDPRLILEPAAVHVSRSMRRVLKTGVFDIRFDTAFEAVIGHCGTASGRRREGTWITPSMRRAYIRLHELGFAHSVEAWADGRLAGGLYGVSIGGVFFGESMFALAPNASKAALIGLARLLRYWEFHLIDCQVRTEHLISLGAVDTPRTEFLQRVDRAALMPTRRGAWTGAPGPDRPSLTELLLRGE